MRNKLYNLLNMVAGLLPKNNGLRVLAYHTVPNPDNFEKQLKYLNKNFSIISIEQLQDFFIEKKPLPKNPLLISFDDGDISVYENGFPLLSKHQLPAVIFVITGLIDTVRTFWCRWVELVYEKEGKEYLEARKQVNYLKTIPEKERKAYVKTLPVVSSVQLTSNHLQELQKNHVFIGNHTHTHPMINNCEEEEIVEEMNAVRSKFKDLNFEENFSIFAYPNGNWEPESEKVLVDEGIKMAFLFDHQLNKDLSKINPMRISRIRVNSDEELSEFKVKVSGFHSKILNIRQNLDL